MRVGLNDNLISSMVEHARKDYPRECVGAIIGDGKSVENSRLIRFSNIQDRLHKDDPSHFDRDARTGYFVDPREVFEFNRNLEKEKLRIIGFYHSHPDHKAYFSQEDFNGAVMWGEPLYPGAVYIVISVFDRAVREAKVFAWNGSTYAEFEDIKLLD
ncbi:MAG: hypothetical protein IEMM0002_0838 [bacterium]|nr:MAG: hypothetical protein IEMM0002_0838 [bacterium]